ncbi:hypothetical protein [Fusibacter sp. 3D3]|uniref:hypothetical protein n=1 Tax=Fusibacter sp. 3D3 TaxID=1048380 RepID=UPI0008534728|nr:hypothetical protein [Fusibacter sp. 3D3]GAU76551.1 hypothetical protein F3D3_1148 [Fusibacter sp. 3D3]
MIRREIYYHYRANKIIMASLICQATLFFIFLGTFIAFSSELNNGRDNLEKIYGNKAIYQLLDGYFDPDEFSEFLGQENALNTLKKFYNKLNTAHHFQYLSMFNQRITVEDPLSKFPEIQAMDGGTAKIINAFQFNKQAYDYFNLVVAKGKPFSLEDFEDKGEIMPVLIGSKYAESFAVGDHIVASYYQKHVILEVIGILKENSLIYFNTDPEFYLDEYIILPYVNYVDPKADFEEEFQKIAYFAMINGYISVEIGDEFAQNMMAEIEVIAQQTGFYNYQFIGSNPNIQPYRGLVNVINLNYTLVRWLFIFSFCLNVITICFQLYFMQKKRLTALAVHYLNGASLSDLVKQFSCEVILIMLISFTISHVVLMYILKIANTQTFAFLLIITIVLTFSVSVFPIYKLIHSELMSLLNNTEDCS